MAAAYVPRQYDGLIGVLVAAAVTTHASPPYISTVRKRDRARELACSGRRCTSTYLTHYHIFIRIRLQGKAHDGIPADAIDTVWHSSLQGKDRHGWDPREQHEGGWNATFAIYVSVLPAS